MQGVTPAVIVREMLLRTTRLGRVWWTPVLAVSVALAFSATYEVFEWLWVAFYPDKGPQWLGHQGDPWDAQADMLAAFMGATLAVTAFARIHDASINRVNDTIDGK